MRSETRQVGSAPRCEENDATARTPLLRSHSDNEAASGIDGEIGQPKDTDKPLPVFQIILLCYMRIIEPIAFFSIAPFIAQMVQRNGNLPVSDVGFYSGLIESLFTATQMLVLVLWNRLGDRIGRKRALVYSRIGMAICPALFGTSTTLRQMIVFRCLAGVFSGSQLIIRTMIADHSTPRTQARAFSLFTCAGNLGAFLGPVLGGALADPVNQYPNLFRGWRYFEAYPYALPGFVVGGISASSALLSALFLDESPGQKSESKTGDGGSMQNAAKPMSAAQLLKAPGVLVVLWVYNHVMLLGFAMIALLPVYLYTPVQQGGLGFSTQYISICMAVQGASEALWLLIVFPYLHHRLGTNRILQICTTMYPFLFGSYMMMNLVLRIGSSLATTCFWVIGAITAVTGPGLMMAFTSCQLALNDVAPTSQAIGMLNVLALTASSATRTVGPGMATVIYAIGVRGQILLGNLVWAVLIPIALVLWAGVYRLPSALAKT